jgi:hypothetical protein
MAHARFVARACSLIVLTGCVSSTPFTASPVFTPEAVIAAQRKNAPRCTLNVISMVDDRLDPHVLGVITGREVLSPPDTGIWLRSMVGGLVPAGIRVRFGPAGSASGGGIDARLELQSVWVDSPTGDVNTAGMLVRVEYLRQGLHMRSSEYRGSARSLNWNSNDGEIQRLINSAAQKLLSKMAIDVRTLCGADSASPLRPEPRAWGRGVHRLREPAYADP